MHKDLDRNTLQVIHGLLSDPAATRWDVKQQISECLENSSTKNLKEENDKVLDMLYKTQQTLELAILHTPTGAVRNKLTEQNIKITNLLNPETSELTPKK